MNEVFLCDGIRTPIGRFGGALASVRTDDLAAIPLRALVARHPALDWAALDDVYYGCANQAGEDNRNVARMAVLLAGLPDSVPAATVNRLCGSSMIPGPGTTVGASATFSATVTDNSGVKSVSVSLKNSSGAVQSFSASKGSGDSWSVTVSGLTNGA